MSNNQLYNLKARTTQQTLGHSATTLQEVIEWAEANRSLPSDPDEIFCGAFEYSVNNDNTLKYLRIFVTAVRLIKLISENPKLIAMDATHKTNWQGYPAILMGTVDRCRHFHPYGFQISCTEKHKDFQFGFRAVSQLCAEINGFSYQPSKLLADNSPTITKGYKKHFKQLPERRIVCWANCIRNWDGKLIFS